MIFTSKNKTYTRNCLSRIILGIFKAYILANSLLISFNPLFLFLDCVISAIFLFQKEVTFSFVDLFSSISGIIPEVQVKGFIISGPRVFFLCIWKEVVCSLLYISLILFRYSPFSVCISSNEDSSSNALNVPTKPEWMR